MTTVWSSYDQAVVTGSNHTDIIQRDFTISFWLCPEEIGIVSGVALPVVVDEAYWYQANILLCRIGAIVALWVEPTVFLADKVVEILGHVIIQIVLLGLLVLMVPVGRLAEHQWLGP